MARLVRRHGPAPIGTRPLFAALVRAIVSQQLSTHAAAAILGRIEQRVGMDPAKLSRVHPATLRKLGLSHTKSACVRDVAKRMMRGALDDLPALPDEEVSARLVEVRGIGPWTAQMVMIFSLGRPDIWPIGDAGIQRAAHNLYAVDLEGLEELGESFRPHRSHAAWYLWRSLDDAE